MVDIPFNRVQQLRDLLTSLDNAYKEMSSNEENPNNYIMYDSIETAALNCDPIGFIHLNQNTLKLGSDLKSALKL